MNKKSQMTFLSYFSYFGFYEPSISKIENFLYGKLSSYKSFLDIKNICWGPVAQKHGIELFSDSLVYIVENTSTNQTPEYTIVFRGTNPFSLSSWIFEDFNISATTQWIKHSPNTSGMGHNASISKATGYALDIHKALEDNKTTLLDWIIETSASSLNNKINLNITGHSLGGLLASTFALFLNDEIEHYNKLHPENCLHITFEVFSFAGPTAGNEQFADFTKSIFKDSLNIYSNELDIATHVWNYNDMQNKLPTIYNPITLGNLQPILTRVTDCVKNLDYTKLQTSDNVASKIVNFFLLDNYLTQAAFQHVVPYLLEATHDEKIDTIDNLLIDLTKELFNKCDECEINEDENSHFLKTIIPSFFSDM